jgi:UDP-N-acetylglucosamine 3-dehydrogenase
MSNKQKKVIRFGLIGFGKHGQWAVEPAMRAAPKVQLKAVADLAPENLVLLPDPKVSTYTDFRRMIKQEALDAVYVATRVESHAEVTLAALRAGLHVITEKPMATSIAECRRMIAAAAKADRLLAVDFESRYVPGFQQIRKWIAEGRLGRLGAIHMDHFWDGHKVTGELAERRHRFCDSSGCLDCGIHKLDLARYFNGGGTWQDIRAYGAWFGEKVRYAPHISIQARLDTGVLVAVNASFAFTAYIPQRLRSSNYEGLAILGEKGVIVMHQAPDGVRHLQLVSETLSEVVPFVPHGHTSVITRLLGDFADSILRGRPLPPEAASGNDGLMAQMITDEANRQAVEAGDSCAVKPRRRRASND